MSSPQKLASVLTLAVFLASGLQMAWAESQPETIKGYVLDSACAFTKSLKKPISAECATACAKAGSPLVILTDSGTIYWPISDATPAQGQNDRLLQFAAKRVVVTGKVYQRAGSRAVVIATIQAEK
ncbi:MAG: hypothetical protein ACLQVG_00400 [Terriglobia bacterium]